LGDVEGLAVSASASNSVATRIGNRRTIMTEVAKVMLCRRRP
jgi:hypothetical protein